MGHYGLSAYDAGLLTATRATADYFEAVLAASPTGDTEPQRTRAKAVANWVIGT